MDKVMTVMKFKSRKMKDAIEFIKTLDINEEQGTMDFGTLLPVPVGLRDIDIKIDKKYVVSYFKGDKLLTVEEKNKILKKFGYDNPLDWCLDNWGCKFNPTEVTLDYNELTIITPETFPYNFVETLCEKAMECGVEIVGVYSADEIGIKVGKFNNEDGDFFHEEIDADEKEGALITCDLWDIEFPSETYENSEYNDYEYDYNEDT